MVVKQINKANIILLCLTIMASYQSTLANDNAKKIDSVNVFYNVDYTLFQSVTSNVNALPCSPSLGRAFPEARNLKPYYTTMVLDINTWKKNKWAHLYGLKVNLDGKLYIYDKALSRPFIADYGLTAFYEIPFKRKLFSAAILLNHTSNGKAVPESRSWNRLMFKVNYKPSVKSTLILNCWIPFDIADNPDIISHYGLMSVKYIYENKFNRIDAQINSNLVNLKGGRLSFKYIRGFKNRYIKLTSRLFYGKGLVLLDYNHSQFEFSIGASISLPNKAPEELEWSSISF